MQRYITSRCHQTSWMQLSRTLIIVLWSLFGEDHVNLRMLSMHYCTCTAVLYLGYTVCSGKRQEKGLVNSAIQLRSFEGDNFAYKYCICRQNTDKNTDIEYSVNFLMDTFSACTQIKLPFIHSCYSLCCSYEFHNFLLVR